jgi:hypothetical protein
MSSSSLRRWRLLVAFALWMVPAAVSAQTVTLAWDPSSGATGYTVRWGTAMGSYPNISDVGNNTTYSISGLTAGATYWAVVQAYNSAGASPYSAPLQFTLPDAVLYRLDQPVERHCARRRDERHHHRHVAGRVRLERGQRR